MSIVNQQVVDTRSDEYLINLINSYINQTHGSLPNIDYITVNQLLSDDFQFSNEEQHHDKIALLEHVFPGWSSIVEGKSSVQVHSIGISSKHKKELYDIVVAHWETNYDCCSGSVWYGTDVDISGKQVRGFQVFASFTVCNGQITKITQRSDTVVKKLGIDVEVQEYRNKHS